MEDPFELDQQALDKKLQLLQENFDRWRQIKSGADALTTEEELADAEDEFRWLTIEIEKSVKSIGWELDDLGETLRLMSSQLPTKKAGGPPPAGQSEARAQYIADMRSLLGAIEGEVKASGAKAERFADAGADASPEPSVIGQPSRPMIAQQPEAQKLSASTERLIESLVSQEEDDDDDVELLIREEDGDRGPARRQFSVMVDSEETPLMRLWRRHKTVLCFVGLVVLLLFIIFIIAVAQGNRKQPGASDGPEMTQATTVANAADR